MQVAGEANTKAAQVAAALLRICSLSALLCARSGQFEATNNADMSL
jgi:hypothetical protein